MFGTFDIEVFKVLTFPEHLGSTWIHLPANASEAPRKEKPGPLVSV